MSDSIQSISPDQSDMATQPISKLFWRYSLPAVMGMLVNGLYVFIDGIFIGRTVGADGLAAINLSWPIAGVIMGIGLMAGTGASALYSIARGARKHSEASQIMGNILILLPIMSLLLGTLLYFTGGFFLELQNGTGQALAMGQDYLKVMAYGALPAIFGAALPMLVRNDERPKFATVLMAVGALLNVVLDWVFVVILQMGVAGAAIASVLAQLVVTIIGIGYFFSSMANERMTLSALTLDLKLSSRMMVTGSSSFVIAVYISFVIMVYNWLFMEYGSITHLAAFTIVGSVQAVYYLIAEGVGHGIQPLVSFNKGAGKGLNIRVTIQMASKWVVGTGLVLFALIATYPENIAAIFVQNDPELMAATVTGLRLHLFAMFLDGFIVVCAAYFQALAMVRLASFIALGNMLVQIPLILTLPDWLGITGVWIAMPVSNIFLAGVVAWFLMRDIRKRTPA